MVPEKKQILVVDDEANLRRVLSAQLARDGYEVHTAEDGEAALAFLKEHHIDLVITDLRMPKVDGMDLLRAQHLAEVRLVVDDENLLFLGEDHVAERTTGRESVLRCGRQRAGLERRRRTV